MRINEQDEEIEFLQRRNVEYVYVTDELGQETKQEQQKAVICKNCGATNHIQGSVGECDYCGTHIQA